MPSKITSRAAVIHLIRRAGLEQPARRVRSAMQPWHRKQNERDDAALGLLLRLTLHDDDNCIDIGANVGAILGEIVKAAPRGQHVAFEPVPWLADELALRFPAVHVQREAVADESGQSTFSVVPESPSRSGLQATVIPELPTESITVQTVRLDDVLTNPPAFVKIDVEGGELEVLRGARQTLLNHRPLVAFEHGRGTQPANEPRCGAIFDEFERANYRLFDFEGKQYDRETFRQVYVSGSRWNFIAHP